MTGISKLQNRTGSRGLALSLAATILAAVVVGIYVWGMALRFQAVAFHYDEGLHAYHLVRAASQLASGSILGYLRAGLEQVVYPPGYSWLAAPLVVWLGAETATLRGLSLLWFLLAALVAWRAAANLTNTRPGTAGLVASLLVLTSAPLIMFASNVLLDSVGLLFVFIFLNAWSRLGPDSSRAHAVGAGLLAGACFLFKYPFGFFVGVTMGVATLVEAVRRQSLRLPPHEWLSIASAALPVILYIAWPGRLEDVLNYGALQPPTTSIWTLGNVTYYGKSLVTQYTADPAIGMLVMAAMSLALFLPHRRATFRWALFFWVGYAILTLKSANEPRFGAVVLPAAFVVAGALFADGLHLLTRIVRGHAPHILSPNAAERRGLLLASGFGVLILTITTAHSLRRRIASFPTMLALGYKTDAAAAQAPQDYNRRPDNLDDLYRFISDSIADPSPRVVVLNTFNELNAPAVGWRLAADRFGVPGAEVLIWPHYAYLGYPDDYDSFRERLIAEDIEYVVILRDARYGPVHAGPRGLAWHLRHDLELLGSELFTPIILEDAVTFERLLANYEFGPPELEGRFRGLSKEWPHVVDVFKFVPDGYVDNPLPNLYAMLDLPLADRNYEVPGLEMPIMADFDGKVTLLGYELASEGTRVKLTFHWQGERWMNEDYHVFIHLVAPETNELAFGYDFIPNPDYPIQWWAPGEVVTETVTLDLDSVPAGTYRLGTGIYDFETQQRVPATAGGQHFDDGWLPLNDALALN